MPTLARPQELSSRVPSTSAVVRPVALTWSAGGRSLHRFLRKKRGCGCWNLLWDWWVQLTQSSNQERTTPVRAEALAGDGLRAKHTHTQSFTAFTMDLFSSQLNSLRLSQAKTFFSIVWRVSRSWDWTAPTDLRVYKRSAGAIDRTTKRWREWLLSI